MPGFFFLNEIDIFILTLLEYGSIFNKMISYFRWFVMKAKIAAIFVVVFMLFGAKSEAVNLLVKAAVSNVFMIVNNVQLQADSMPEILNYKNQIYVLLRFVASQLGALVGYDPISCNVYIDHNNHDQVRSKVRTTRT